MEGKKEKKSEIITLRCTPQEKQKLINLSKNDLRSKSITAYILNQTVYNNQTSKLNVIDLETKRSFVSLANSLNRINIFLYQGLDLDQLINQIKESIEQLKELVSKSIVKS